MRTYTFVFSTLVHAAVACVALFSTVLATDELPEPRRASVFVQVFAPPSRVPPPAVRPKVTTGLSAHRANVACDWRGDPRSHDRWGGQRPGRARASVEAVARPGSR